MSLTLVYDGGCLFCRHFALRSELNAGINGLIIIDGRSSDQLRLDLKAKGLKLKNGAVLIEGDQTWHGSDAIEELCRRMQPSEPLLRILKSVFKDSGRARSFYPFLLYARRISLALTGIPDDPDDAKCID